MIVLDASIVVKLLVNEPSSALALSRIEYEAIRLAPDLCPLEVANAMSKKVRYDGLPLPAAMRALGTLPRVVTQFVGSSEVMAAGMALSVLCRHALYDCMYLALAQRENCRLLTADAKFAAACRVAGVADQVELLA